MGPWPPPIRDSILSTCAHYKELKHRNLLDLFQFCLTEQTQQQLLEDYRARKKLKKLKRMKKQKSGEEDLINGGTPEHDGGGGRDNAAFEGDGAEAVEG